MSEEHLSYHLECPSGLSGDMFLGACLDLGLPLSALEEVPRELGLQGVELEARKATRGGVGGTRFRVLLDGRPLDGPDPEEGAEEGGGSSKSPARDPGSGEWARATAHRSFSDIRQLVQGSRLPSEARERALEMFARLAEVEAAIHGVALEAVHFHEIGAEDSLVDIVGAALAVERLSMHVLSCGEVVIGAGTVRTAHGELPVPAPATAELIRGVPTIGGGRGELLTPTGALILSQLSSAYGPQPAMRVTGLGYGLGRRETPGRPNLARISRGCRLRETSEGWVWSIETQVDDAAGERLGFLMEQLYAAGALEVFFTAVQMKKNRPGTLITVLAAPSDRQRLATALLRGSGSLGCRFRRLDRLEAERSWRIVETRYGAVRIKIAALDGREYGWTPEFEDCRRLAQEHRVELQEVYHLALVAAGQTGREAGAAASGAP